MRHKQLSLPLRLKALSFLVIALSAVGQAQTRIYVSTKGNNSFNGLSPHPGENGSGPLRTLFAARDKIRAMKQAGSLSPDGAIVSVAPGTYTHLSTLDLNALDSGGPTSRIIWRAEQPGTVTLDGSRSVKTWDPTDQRAPLDKVAENVRAKIWTARLANNGISETGQLAHSGSNVQLKPNAAELFWNGQRMTLVQWPNHSYAYMTAEGSGNSFDNPTVVTNFNTLKTPDFVLPDGQMPDPNHEFWMRGVLNWRLFFEFHERVDRIDRATHNLSIRVVGGGHLDDARRAQYDSQSRGRFHLVNSLWELDYPGEYYIDRGNNFLYFYPPSIATAPDVRLSMAKHPIVRLRNLNNVTFEGFVIEYGRVGGVLVQNSSLVTLQGLKVRNVGGTGITVEGGNNVTVKSCTVHDTGEGGVDLGGGNRSTLTRGNNVVRNCDISRTGSFQPFYRPGVNITGFGNVARNNAIHDMPHCGIIFHGNDHTMERNEVYRTVQDSFDTAAIYAGLTDWTCFGNVIRENYIYDTRKMIPGYHLVHGIYVDAMFSQALIERNILQDVTQPMQIGGGHQNVFRNNVMVDSVGGMRIDDRGLQIGNGNFGLYWQFASQVPWNTQPWITKYPKLHELLTDPDQSMPRGNVFSTNVLLRCYTDNEQRIWGLLEIWGANANNPDACLVEKNTITNVSPFASDRLLDFTPLEGTEPYLNGFQPINGSVIGVQTDRFIDGSLIGYRSKRRQGP